MSVQFWKHSWLLMLAVIMTVVMSSMINPARADVVNPDPLTRTLVATSITTTVQPRHTLQRKHHVHHRRHHHARKHVAIRTAAQLAVDVKIDRCKDLALALNNRTEQSARLMRPATLVKMPGGSVQPLASHIWGTCKAFLAKPSAPAAKPAARAHAPIAKAAKPAIQKPAAQVVKKAPVKAPAHGMSLANWLVLLAVLGVLAAGVVFVWSQMNGNKPTKRRVDQQASAQGGGRTTDNVRGLPTGLNLSSVQ